MNPDLLSPTIASARVARTYSVPATFWAAFFGGPLAAVFMHGLNARHLGRWRRDLPALVVAALVAVGMTAALATFHIRPHLAPLARDLFADASNNRVVLRGAGLLVWAALYLRLRTAYRAAQLVGEHRRGFLVGLGCVVASAAGHFLVAVAVVGS